MHMHRTFHPEYSTNLFRIGVDSPFGNEKTELLPTWISERALSWIELDIIPPEVGKGFSKVSQQVGTLP